mgnify:CR=1 FL=1
MKDKQDKTNDLDHPDEIERCVLCGRKTGYLRSEHIELRQYYIEGAGQLCKKCFMTFQIDDL